jgi:hypothetical protein
VFWQVGASATLGTGSSFQGNILALTSITLTTAADVDGRILARNGAVTLDTNDAAQCAGTPPVPVGNPAGVPALDAIGLMIMSVLLAGAGLFVVRRSS